MKRSFIKTEYLAAILLLLFCGLMLAVGSVQAHYVNEAVWTGVLLPPNGDSEYLTVETQHFVLQDMKTNGISQITRSLIVPVQAEDYAMSGTVGCYAQAKDDLAVLSAAISGEKITQEEDGQYLTLAAGESTELILTIQTVYPSVAEALPVTVTVWWLADFGGTEQLLKADFTLWVLPPDEVEPVHSPEEILAPTESSEPPETTVPVETMEVTEVPEPPETTVPVETMEATEVPEPPETTAPTEPPEPDEQPEAMRGIYRTVQLATAPTGRFAEDGPLPMQISPSEGTEYIRLEFSYGECEGLFPAGTQYSTDLGETVYRLYEEDTIRILPPDDTESFWLLLNFSNAELTWQEDRQISLFFTAVSGENTLMTQELNAEAANQMPRPLQEEMHVINETDTLELSLTGEWGTGLWDPVIERLSRDEESQTLQFTEIDNVEYRFVFEQSSGVLSLKTAERDTPAGTYRLLLKLQYGDVTAAQVTVPFFVIYSTENAGTGS